MKKIWIIGGSSGIGKAVALELARKNYDVIISSRNSSILEEVSKQSSNLQYISFDASIKNEFLQAAEKVKALWGYIDIVFLNAGTCEYIDSTNFSSAPFERMFKNNFFSMVYGVEASLPLLRESKSPMIIGMSSTVAFLGLPRASAYSSTKAAIKNFLESLRVDLIPEKISVSIVFPGFVKTALTDLNDFSMPGLMSAEKAAAIIVKGIENKKANIIFPFWFSIILKIISFLPSKFQANLVYNLTKRKNAL
jgi:short-subunit dehydrogenase